MQNSKKTFSPFGNYIYSLLQNLIPKCGKGIFGKQVIVGMPGFLFLCFTILSITSCDTTKNLVYFQDIQKDTTLQHVIAKNGPPTIQKNDFLSIAVASLSPDVLFYNAPQNTIGPLNGYLVDEGGNISFIKLGTLHVEGMTRKELKDTLQNALVPFLKDVVVSVGFLNRHITVMGAVKAEQVVPIISDNMTILDALASSGDIAENGRIDNVTVIRDSSGAKQFKKLSLRDHSIFFSPYYYMQPNDIVYVEPTKVKTKFTVVAAVSLAISIISLYYLVKRG